MDTYDPRQVRVRAGRDLELRVACPLCTPVFIINGAADLGALLIWAQIHGVERHGFKIEDVVQDLLFPVRRTP